MGKVHLSGEMSILKTTSFQILSASIAGQGERTFHVAHRAAFDDVERRPGYLYVRSRAISSRINENYDGFNAEEIEKGYQTFMGKPVFVSHHNSNHRRARGAIVAVALHKDHLSTGEADTWVEVMMEVDAIRFPLLAKAIVAGEIARTSMGCDVAYSSCTFCGNKAYTEAEYCKHIPRMKGKRIRRVDAKTGASSMVLVAEQCFGLNFFENSLLVEEPADPTAFVLGIDGMGVTAARRDWHDYDPEYDLPFDDFDRSQGRSDDNPWGDDEDRPFDPRPFTGSLPAGFILLADQPTDDNEPTAADDDINADLIDPHTTKIGAVVDKTCPGCGTGYDSHSNPKECADCGTSLGSDHAYHEWRTPMAAARAESPNHEQYRAHDGCYAETGQENETCPHGQKYRAYSGDYYKSAGSKLPRQCGNFTPYKNNVATHGGACKHCSLPESAHKKTASFGGKRIASLVRHGINETIAPPEVDTLRASECPICGSDAYNGEECPVCMFIKPPDMFMDPDLEAAQNADLRQDESEEALAVGDQVGNDHLQGQTPVGDDLMAAGQEGDLQCDSCGAVQPGSASAGTDPAVAGGQPPATPADPAIPNAGAPTTQPTSQPPTQPGAEPPPPVNDESMPLAQGPPSDDDVPPAGKELPKPKDGENDDGQDDGSKAETKPKGDPADKGKVETDIDAGKQDSKDDGTKPADGSKPPTEDQAVDTLQKDLKPGDPCPVCDGKGKLQPKADDSTDDTKVEDKDANDDKDQGDDTKKDDGPPWQKGKNSHKEVKAQSSFNNDHPGVSDMAAPTVKVLASHQAEIRRLKEENAQLRRSVNFIAAAVGITRFADELNPAEPIPQPAGGAPSQTSDQARVPAAQVDVREIGSTPVTDVNADATTTVDQIGGINADTPYSINTEVTTPVAGTETRIPLDQVRTLPEIQFGNPLVGDTAFPLQGEFAEKATLGSKGRTYAALRLARLRKAAGTDTSGQDEIVLANAIDTNAALADGAIAQEIEILTQVVTREAAPANPRAASRRLVPQSAQGVERTIPSVAVGEGLPAFTSASASDDDAFAFCD
jgi:hypothetical protein